MTEGALVELEPPLFPLPLPTSSFELLFMFSCRHDGSLGLTLQFTSELGVAFCRGLELDFDLIDMYCCPYSPDSFV